MVIFGPDLVSKVLAGTKTVTRRRLTHRDGRDIHYHAGKVYAVQPGRGKPHVGHILIEEVGVQPLRMMRLSDFEAEGLHPRAFIEYWELLHGRYDPDEVVAVIWFAVAPRCSKCAAWQL